MTLALCLLAGCPSATNSDAGPGEGPGPLDGGAVASCDQATCPGCCGATGCEVGTAPTACGVGGRTCQACPAGSACDAGACGGCDGTTCPGGCCFEGMCRAPLDTLCGDHGAVCSSCVGGATDRCKAGACACGNGPACANGQWCASGLCVCDATSCGAGRRCSGTLCVCDATTCPDGCCRDGRCEPVSVTACGARGGVCGACGGTSDSCDAGTCRCGSQGPCGAGLRCSAGACVCDAASCPSGCCQGNQCLAQTAATCGAQGAACTACDATVADTCSGGQCRCGGASRCAAGQRCVGGVCQCSCYLDHDRDSFYVARQQVCPCPAGQVELPAPPAKLDCDDNDPLAYPGQPGYSAISRVGGGFDFNCNGVEEVGYHFDAGTCLGRDPLTDCLGVRLWDLTAPACGVQGTIIDCTQQIAGTVRTCVPWTTTTPLLQTCQ